MKIPLYMVITCDMRKDNNLCGHMGMLENNDRNHSIYQSGHHPAKEGICDIEIH